MQQKVIKVPEKDLVIIELEGRLDAVSSAQVEKTVADLAAAGKPPHIIIDFTNVSYLSSAGLRVLLSTHKLLLRHNHKLICAAFTDGSLCCDFGRRCAPVSYATGLKRPSEQLKRTASQAVLRPKVIIIAGPTAVGKTAVSLALAQKTRCQVISADSMQVYRGADIGTNKISLEVRRKVPHYLIDVRAIDQPFNVVDFANYAETALDHILAVQDLPLLVGGTGFYIRTFMSGIPQGPPSDPEIREQLRQDYDKFGAEMLFQKLKQLDPIYAASITMQDQQKVVRALEIITISGQKVSDIPKPEADAKSSDYDFRCWFLHMDRQILYPKIEARCDQMLAEGFLEEVRRLQKEGIENNPSASRAIGYRQALDFLKGPQTFEEYESFRILFKKASRQYAKRQYTWFRKEPAFRWLDVTPYSTDQIADIIYQDILHSLG